jgi:hypothetical protein
VPPEVIALSFVLYAFRIHCIKKKVQWEDHSSSTFRLHCFPADFCKIRVGVYAEQLVNGVYFGLLMQCSSHIK